MKQALLTSLDRKLTYVGEHLECTDKQSWVFIYQANTMRDFNKHPDTFSCVIIEYYLLSDSV